MIIKAKDRGGAFNLADHLTSTTENERVTVLGGRHLIDEYDVHSALLDMHIIHLGGLESGGRCRKHLHHVMINPSDDLNAEQWADTWGLYEAEYGLQDQPYIEVEHHKEGRTHRHRVYHRIRENAPAIEFSQNYARNEYVCRVLEHKFGHDLTIGGHNRTVIDRLRKDGHDLVADWMRDGLADTIKRPIAARNHTEHQIEKRTGQNLAEIKALIREAWDTSDSGQSMEAALIDKGLILARGDRTDFVIVDATGQPHSMARQLDDTSTEVKSRMADLDPATLPSVDHASTVQMEIARQAAAATEREKPALLTRNEIKEFTAAAWQDFETARDFQKTLADQGLIFAQGRRGILIVDQNGKHYNLSRLVPDKAKDVDRKLADIDFDALPSLDEAREAQKRAAEPPKEIPTPEPPENEITAPDAPQIAFNDDPDHLAAELAKAARDKRRRKQLAEEARKKRDLEAERLLVEQQRAALKAEIERGEEDARNGFLARARAAFKQKVRVLNRIIDRVKSVFTKDQRQAPAPDKPDRTKGNSPVETPHKSEREELPRKRDKPPRKIIDFDNLEPVKDDKKGRDRDDDDGRGDR